ncbi:YihY/virulence factor BrkB family protein [Microbacterium sp.]|uniref:YihY/virulence factor BrkB family protein n=1 Tax=Microbacterium sp. TaxID=51671 RepID=UPI0039E55F69
MSEDRSDLWRARWEDSGLRERLDEPIERATRITRKTLAWFPVRVWRHFLQHNGFLLAAAISYQSIFAIFAIIYVAFAGVGLWLGGSRSAIDGLIELINSYIPGLIGPEGAGLIPDDAVEEIARSATSVLAVTGAVAVMVAIWTAIGFITFTRRAVRDIFGLPFDDRNYLFLKARDFVAGALFGGSLVLGAGLGWAASGAVEFLFRVVGGDILSVWGNVLSRLASLVIALVINTGALAFLVRFLTGTTLPWGRIWPGAMLGGGALVVLQLGAGLLLYYTPANPLLATFSVFIGFLLWFRLAGIVILVASSWVAVSAHDRDVPLVTPTEAQRRAAEREALLVAARLRVRDAHVARSEASLWARWVATREVRRAEDELARLDAGEEDAPASR